MFDYILKPEIFELIEEEFDMYLYHLCDEQDRSPGDGYAICFILSSNSWFGRTPSTILIAAAQPDKNTWLIYYPYYIKY